MQKRVQIRVKGQIDETWSEWFGGLSIEHGDQELETTLTGFVPDQAAVYGLLARLRDIGLELISVESEEVGESEER